MMSTVNDWNCGCHHEKDSLADDSPIREIVFSIMLSASKTGLDDDLNIFFLLAALHVQDCIMYCF